MPRLNDISWIKVPGWKILNHVGRSEWNLQCDACGQVSKKKSRDIRSGTVFFGCKTCGVTKNSKHGHTKSGNWSGTYRAWASMKRRCNAGPDSKDYKYYGSRGIKVCDRWQTFENFLEDMGERPRGESILDRIDNDLGYFRENCRWASTATSQQNRRNSKWVIFNGRKMVLAELVRLTGMSRDRVSRRVGNVFSPSPDVTAIMLQSGSPIPIEVRRPIIDA